jgi:hypothetical protein
VNDQEHHLRTIIEGLERENAALREQIDDWENAVLHARDNRSQEQHCTCVPPLLGKVKQLERANAALRADKERLDWLQNSPYWPHPPLGEDIRAAIDAARKEQP